MPELPEVETVRNTLKKYILNKTIKSVELYYDDIVATDKTKFINGLKNKKIKDILRVGKWLIFELDDFYMLSHLRMEGKYFIKNYDEERNKHEHVIFNLNDCTLRYHDTRKFGKMYLVEKDKLHTDTPLKDIGLEPFSKEFDANYLKAKLNKNKPIKTLLLEQDKIAGIGNIYADEILFLSRINPLTKGSSLTNKNLEDIAKYSKSVLEEAIKMGGTTIRSYTSSLGVTGRFQQSLKVHCREKEECFNCKEKIIKITVSGRGTYYCPNCQKEVM